MGLHRNLSPAEADQREVVAFLAAPATHGGAPVETVETHISRVFLAGDRAWKLKRAVRTNYLDFTALAARERACRREIEVNAGAAGLYLGAVPVTRGPAGLALGGAGEPVEWLVEMRRFDRALEFDRLLEAGRLDLATVEVLADAAAALHAAAPRTPSFGSPNDVEARLVQIAEAASAALGEARGALDWRRMAQAALLDRDKLIERRRAAGLVRRCHGDLHLGNVVMLDGRPVPFDAIEFEEAIASIDILYDLAFLLADFALRGRRDFANVALSRWLSATDDLEGLALLPLFLSMRMAVRALTLGARGEAKAGRRALALARETLKPAPAPALFAIGGVSGSGKTTLARRLAPDLGAPLGAAHLRSDVARKRLAGVAPETPLEPGAYSPKFGRRVYARLLRQARRGLRAGASILIDATFLDPQARDLAKRLASREGARFHGIWLDLPAREAGRRVRIRRGDASDATTAVVRAQAARARSPEGWTRLGAGCGIEPLERLARAALGLRTEGGPDARDGS